MARPAKFDRQDLLDTATSLFSGKGYRGVSIGDLVKETGVLTGSIYSCFGSKDAVFIECIHRYAEVATKLYIPAEQEPTALGKIERYFEAIVEDSLADPERRGCFVVNALLEIAPEKPEISSVLNHYVQLSESWLADKLKQAVESGEIKKEANPERLAIDLFGIVYALRVKTRVNESDERIRSFKDSMLAAILGPWRKT